MSTYDDDFFDYVNSGATHSAQTLLPFLKNKIPIHSVLDVGCGQGAWLKVWKDLGIPKIHGVDGDYVQRDRLWIAEEEFSALDLAKPFHLDQTFDLVQSLEVGEHLPTASAADFVASLVKHGKRVLFSAAAKGQGGDDHINEQDYEFWRDLFRKHDYHPIDYLRHQVLQNKSIEPWYRYNAFLYVAASEIDSLPEDLKSYLVPEDKPLRDISPPLYQVRKKLIRLLPVAIVTKLAKFKERRITRKRKSKTLS